MFKDEWGLELPNLVISVTGGAKDFVMDPKFKYLFRQGLLKVSNIFIHETNQNKNDYLFLKLVEVWSSICSSYRNSHFSSYAGPAVSSWADYSYPYN